MIASPLAGRVYWSSDPQAEDLIDAEAILSEGLPLPPCLADGVSPAVLMTEALVHVELPTRGLQLRIPANNSDEGSTSTSSSHGASLEKNDAVEDTLAAGKPLAYLPSIRLGLSLPHAYPSSEPPCVIDLRAIWLTAAQSSALKDELLSHWHEVQLQGADFGAGPIIFQWTEWLRSSALTFLGISETLIVRPKGAGLRTPVLKCVSGQASSSSAQLTSPEEAWDRREGSHGACMPVDEARKGGQETDVSWTAEEVVMSLIRYSGSRSHEAFLHGSCRSGLFCN